ncbi:tRNA(Met) cytidine acetyltransferase TmcA [Thiomicrorhabdus sp.]|uniref:tRNA(Met) cytidine acetyltransferase TmcA n=1 Tax=Thiomicrorhabdus sp. TaxID=2039724 RepID=UPI002AA8E313|nr:GNAT family N-acetyltransferase [Thiomicrorhabdus sp.]
MSDLLSLRKQLAQCKHRQLVILSGSELWQKQQLTSLYKQDERVFWISSNSVLNSKSPTEITRKEPFTDFHCEVIEPIRLSYYLGQEIAGAIIDVRHGLSADTLGITAGMIQAGGLLILLTPETAEWQTLANPENSRFLNTPYTISDAKKGFTQHLIQTWQHSEIVWLEENNPKTSFALPQCFNPTISLPTDDQKAALKAIHTVAFGHRKRPLVITADRGRGKSSILGIAAIESLINGKSHIAITASRLDQVGAAFEHAAKWLEAQINNRLDTDQELSGLTLLTNKPGLLEFSYQGQTKTIEFLAPDHLILNPTGADLLLVDEAAHLPTPVLTEILLRHHRLVFATTLHGYEGSGRGFELRFKKQLNQQTPDWKNLTLHQPIRWAENDPLEKAINKALLLDANITELDEIKIKNIAANKLCFQQVEAQQLIANPGMLKTLFGLLVQAHYQTSPNDLQQLLNAPNIKIIIASIHNQESTPNAILGAALCIEEGKISPGSGRAHGHLVPQLLTKHYAQNDFLMLSTLRIMRIAVHPQCQRIGIGKELISQVEQLGKQNRVDYICSSFGSSEELLPFWFEQYFWPLHVGVKRDKASGSHNIVVAKPISAMARQALSLIQTSFQEQFPHLLLESLPNLPSLQVWPIVQTFRFKQRNVGYEKALQSYQNGSRPYESVSNKLWKWSLQSAAKVKQGSITEQAIWCDKVLKKLSWQEVAHQHHLAGRKGVEEQLKACIDTWLQHKPNVLFKK